MSKREEYEAQFVRAIYQDMPEAEVAERVASIKAAVAVALEEGEAERLREGRRDWKNHRNKDGTLKGWKEFQDELIGRYGEEAAQRIAGDPARWHRHQNEDKTLGAWVRDDAVLDPGVVTDKYSAVFGPDTHLTKGTHVLWGATIGAGVQSSGKTLFNSSTFSAEEEGDLGTGRFAHPVEAVDSRILNTGSYATQARKSLLERITIHHGEVENSEVFSLNMVEPLTLVGAKIKDGALYGLKSTLHSFQAEGVDVYVNDSWARDVRCTAGKREITIDKSKVLDCDLAEGVKILKAKVTETDLAAGEKAIGVTMHQGHVEPPQTPRRIVQKFAYYAQQEEKGAAKPHFRRSGEVSSEPVDHGKERAGVGEIG